MFESAVESLSMMSVWGLCIVFHLGVFVGAAHAKNVAKEKELEELGQKLSK
jgi:hypothetical protein